MLQKQHQVQHLSWFRILHLKHNFLPGRGGSRGAGGCTGLMGVEVDGESGETLYALQEGEELWFGEPSKDIEVVGVGSELKEESDIVHCPSSCGIAAGFLLATTDGHSLAFTGHAVVLGRLPAVAAVSWGGAALAACAAAAVSAAAISIFFSYCTQHCFICRPSDSTVPTDAGIEPRTVATGALAVRRSNHQARSHPQLGQISSALGQISSALGQISSFLLLQLLLLLPLLVLLLLVLLLLLQLLLLLSQLLLVLLLLVLMLLHLRGQAGGGMPSFPANLLASVSLSPTFWDLQCASQIFSS